MVQGVDLKLIGATHSRMSKTEPELPEAPEGWTKKGWDKYLKEHGKKLRRLEREANGDNMSYPPEPNYE